MSRREIFDAIKAARARGWAANDPEIGLIDGFLDRIGVPTSAAPAASEPRWLTIARAKIGQREIAGPQHNSWIAQGWARLGAGWFNDDETPWCGYFVADCMDAAGLPYPGKGEFARALAWASYGAPLATAIPGAIGVKKRQGGNHVFFIVGETPDRRFFKALGGNQSNAVTIMDIAKADTFAIRWPTGVPIAVGAKLPVMPAGTVSRNEA